MQVASAGRAQRQSSAFLCNAAKPPRFFVVKNKAPRKKSGIFLTPSLKPTQHLSIQYTYLLPARHYFPNSITLHNVTHTPSAAVLPAQPRHHPGLAGPAARHRRKSERPENQEPRRICLRSPAPHRQHRRHGHHHRRRRHLQPPRQGGGLLSAAPHLRGLPACLYPSHPHRAERQHLPPQPPHVHQRQRAARGHRLRHGSPCGAKGRHHHVQRCCLSRACRIDARGTYQAATRRRRAGRRHHQVER